ncbi:hypothetical protein GCK72_025760 [Caenorhabditis remanei]|uniref:Uncharacterized protein n=1 Tax=Caenorhabditis remanei TaxID=31234 RepID=A0A6A5G3B0_CAERE|nr:hypothetical protein GCK72_025760 [Caenorhabditis remanei]KAF1749293.1 hypothetical protein GCK72_025760 [Caenorhabditis remanei]
MTILRIWDEAVACCLAEPLQKSETFMSGLHLDINKRSYNHVPGECGVIPNLPGIISLTTSTSGRLYMTTNSKDGLSDNTHVFTFYSDNRTAREIEIRGAPTKWKLKPGAISVASEPNNPKIFVVNRRTGSVDIFETNNQNDMWNYHKSLKNEKFEGILDLSASSPNSFYYIKSSIFGDIFALNLFERYLLHAMDAMSSSPSMVFRVVVPADENKELIITQLYSNDGATISQANMTVRAGRSLLISNGNKILNCHL